MREKPGYHDQYRVLKERFPGQETISIAETCEVLGVSRGAVTKEIKKKSLPCKKIGRIYRVSLSSLASYMC